MTASTYKPDRQTLTRFPSEFPSELKLRHILKTLPRQVFLKNRQKAWSQVIINVLWVVLGYIGLAFAPWYFVPLLWIFTGTGLTGFFVIGHDCGHRSFAQRKWVNNLVGHLITLPIIYPFHSWRILHNHHHKHTNKLEIDNAWAPFTPAFYESLPRLLRWGYQALRGKFWWVGSIVHWANLHFNWHKFEGKEREQVRFSVLFVLIGGTIFLSVLITATGFLGFVKFWLMPWLVFHFWMSSFTLFHHTAKNIPFQPINQWHEAAAQLYGTIHCQYPSWVEFICHDINVHIPHHLSTAIPSYNLRQAYQSIKANWGDYCQESRFSWALIREVTEKCHLYSPHDYYQSFQEHEARKHLS